MKTLWGHSWRYRWLALAIVAVMTALMLYHIRTGARVETDLDEYMPQDHPAFVYSDLAEEWFDIKDAVVIAVENPEGIYNSRSLEKVKSLTDKVSRLDGVNPADVTSLYTAENIVGSEFGLDVTSFFSEVPDTDEGRERLAQSVRENSMVAGRLVSEDETTALVVVRIDDEAFSMHMYDQMRQLASEFEGPEVVHVAGRPVVESGLALLAPADMKRMVPAVSIVIFLVLLLVLRSLGATVITLLIVLISTVVTFGLMAMLKIPVYSVTTMMPVMLIAIGVADGIHVFSHLRQRLVQFPTEGLVESMVATLRAMWWPIVMTSVTTAVGFLSLLTSEVYPVKYFGLFTAVGVLVAMVLSLSFLPAGVVVLRVTMGSKRASGKVDAWGRLSKRLSLWLETHRRTVAAAALAVALAAGAGTSQVWINSSFLDKFESNSEIVVTENFVNSQFGGTTTLNVVLESERKGAFKSPDVLKKVAAMQQQVESLAEVGTSFSLADYLARMNKVLNEDRQEYDKVPDTGDSVAQYLLLYEMSGDPDNLWRVVNYDYNRLNVTFQLKKDDSRTMNAVLELVEQERTKFESMGVSMAFAGSGYKALVFTELILEGQIKSLLLSFLVVVLLLAGMFRSLVVGLIAAVPIALTALIGFGFMGVLGIPLSTTTALLSSISVGIGIDYAVHFLDRYKVNLYTLQSKSQALAATMNETGRAIGFNAVVVVLGFLVLTLSVFPPSRALGALISLGMFTSFIATVTVMVVLTRPQSLTNPRRIS